VSQEIKLKEGEDFYFENGLMSSPKSIISSGVIAARVDADTALLDLKRRKR